MKKLTFLFASIFPTLLAAQTYDINGDYKISGKIGVGTATPSLWFAGKVFEMYDSRPVFKLNSSDILSTITFTNDQINASSHYGEFHINHEVLGSSSNQSKLRFSTYPGGNVLTLRADGNVGIGTTSPNSPLEVKSANGTFSTDGSGVTIDRTNTNCGSWLIFKNNSNTYWTLKNGLEGCGNIGNINFIDSNGNHRFTLKQDGNVGIGTTNPDEKLVVDGKIRSEEVKVEVVNGPDYVFASGYQLPTLQETKEYISKNQHLPEIPSAKEMETNGIDLGEMNMKLLKKIEELTLHQIDLLEKLEAQQLRIEKLEKGK